MKNQELLDNLIRRHLSQTGIVDHPENKDLCSLINSSFIQLPPRVKESIDSQIIGKTFEKLKFLDFSEVYYIPQPRFPGEEFKIIEQTISLSGGGFTEHNMIAKEEMLADIYLGLDIDMNGAIDRSMEGVEVLSNILSEKIEDFFISKLIDCLDIDKVHTELANINQGDKVLEAILKIDTDTICATSTGGVDYILCNPKTKMEIDSYGCHPDNGYQWMYQMPAKFITSRSVPEQYLYTICYKPGKTLGFIVGFQDFIKAKNVVGRSIVSTNCDYGIANQKYFGRIKVKSLKAL